MRNKYVFLKFSVIALMVSVSACEKAEMMPSSVEKASLEKSQMNSVSDEEDFSSGNRSLPDKPYQFENMNYNAQVSNINNKSILTLAWPQMLTVLYPNTLPVASTVNIVIQGPYDDGKVKQYYFYNVPVITPNISYNGRPTNAVEFDLTKCNAYFSGSIGNMGNPTPVSGQLIADDSYSIVITTSEPNTSLVPNDRGNPEPFNTTATRMYINDL